jgi:ElaB/YqjD/DUF883 family membrane-anchored ribosome-binding protein
MSDLSNDSGAGGATANGNGAVTPGASDASKTRTKAGGAAGSAAPAPNAGSAKTSGSAAGASTSGATSGATSASDNDDIGQSEGVSRLKATIQKLEDRAGELRRWGAARQDDAREIVEDKPLVVVGAALGVGLLLGILAARV